jgi:2,3-bisphosphoglycerate-dependent phosphoglycerate mutase
MVSAHGNSLRSIVMYIEKITPEKIVHLEIPTGIPQFYSYEDGVIKRTY